MDEVKLVMAYTGWTRETVEGAIKQWKGLDPSWNADYLLIYLEDKNSEKLAESNNPSFPT